MLGKVLRWGLKRSSCPRSLLHFGREGRRLSSTDAGSAYSASCNKIYSRLQDIIESEKLNYLIVPMSDYHMSEYIPDEFKLIEKICRFTGSSGTLLLSKSSSTSASTSASGTAVNSNKNGYLFVDGRYHVQAENEVDRSHWNIVKLGLDNSPASIPDLVQSLRASKEGLNSLNATSYSNGRKCNDIIVGLDPFLHNIDYVNTMRTMMPAGSLQCLKSSSIVSANDVKTDSILKNSMYIHNAKHAGQLLGEKVNLIREELTSISRISNRLRLVDGVQRQVTGVLISALDEIAWTLNLRGSDVECNPVFTSYLVITMVGIHLFVDRTKISDDIIDYLKRYNVNIHDYDVKLVANLIKSDILDSNGFIAIDKKSTSYGLYDLIKAKSANVINSENNSIQGNNTLDDHSLKGIFLMNYSIVSLMKSIKNDSEIAGMKAAHLRDAAAIVEFLAYIEKSFEDKKDLCISEIEIDEVLLEKRKLISKHLYVTDSFSTISAVGRNAAIVHYRANAAEPHVYLKRFERKRCSQGLDTSCMLLLDSGAQYLDGTTDVTRTLCVGVVDNKFKEIKDSYTRVLKGFLAVDQAVLPFRQIDNSYKMNYYEGKGQISSNCGFVLDTLARQFLLKVGKNYLHGTGHGVGASLNVHESPVSLNSNSSHSIVNNKMALQPGMIFSNEPGYYSYEDGYGIRIENLLLTVLDEKSDKSTSEKFIRFERLTHVPIQKDLIDINLLSGEEKSVLNSYHKDVLERVSPLLVTDLARDWLIKATSEI